MNKVLTATTLAACLTLTGCATTDMALPGMSKQNVPANPMSLLDGKSMILAKRQAPSFTAMTGGKATLGMIGGLAMGKAGNRIVKANDVQDPARNMAREIAGVVSSAHRVNVVGVGSRSINKLSISEIARSHADSDLVLDVRTKNWGFSYFPTDWKHYRVTYNAKMRLIDTATQTVVMKATCNRLPKKKGGEPTRKQLLANNASLLKQMLDKQASICADKFKRKLMTP